MSKRLVRPLPVLRLAVYLVILAGCGAVAAHECFFLLAANTTLATVVAVGQTTRNLRHARFWADYEYFDEEGVRHVGRAQNVIRAAGEPIEIQYLRHAPDTSRPAAGLTGVLCFGAVAVLAAVVFAAEILVRRRRRKTRRTVNDADG